MIFSSGDPRFISLQGIDFSVIDLQRNSFTSSSSEIKTKKLCCLSPGGETHRQQPLLLHLHCPGGTRCPLWRHLPSGGESFKRLPRLGETWGPTVFCLFSFHEQRLRPHCQATCLHGTLVEVGIKFICWHLGCFLKKALNFEQELHRLGRSRRVVLREENKRKPKHPRFAPDLGNLLKKLHWLYPTWCIILIIPPLYEAND